jgi:hypothetical protein
LTRLHCSGIVGKLVFVTESDIKRQKAIAAALAGLARVPITRAQQVARFELLRDTPNLTHGAMGRLCGVSEATVKRWRKWGTEDARSTKIQRREALAAQAEQTEAPPEAPAAARPAIRPIVSRPSPRSPADEDHMTVGDLLGEGGEDLSRLDAIHALKRIACNHKTTRALKVQALRVIAAYENQRGRIPWESVKPDQIPVEVQHRLAGMLLHLVQLDELPEAVKLASPARRRVYRLLGLLPATDALADRVLERYQALAAELRAELEPEAAAVELPPLVVSLAVQAGRVPR